MADDEALEQAIQASLTEASIRASSSEAVGVAYIQSYEIDEEEAIRRSITDVNSDVRGGGRGVMTNNQHGSAPLISSSSSSTVIQGQQGIINPHTINSTATFQQSQSQIQRTTMERNIASTNYNSSGNINSNNVRSSSNVRGSNDSALVNRIGDTVSSHIILMS